MKKAIWVIVTIALMGAAWMGYQHFERSKVKKIVYQPIKVERGRIDLVILSTGVVEPQNRLEIKPPLAGRVDDVLVEEGVNVKKGQTIAWMSSMERAALIDAATAKGVNELKQWEELYRRTPILAPINGMIIKRNIEPGQTFTTQDAIFVMSDRLTVKAQVDETDIAQVKLKQKCKLVLDAYADQSIAAHVDQIAFDATTVNNVTTYLVDVIPEKTPSHMRSGMTANVTFDVESRDNILLVPSDAIKARDGRFYVMTPGSGEDEEPEEHIIEVGISDGKHTQVVSGLGEGDTVLMPEFDGKESKAKSTSPFSPFRPPSKKR